MTKGPGNDTLPIKIFAQMRFGIQPQNYTRPVHVPFVGDAGRALVASRLNAAAGLTVWGLGASDAGFGIRETTMADMWFEPIDAAAVVAVVRRARRGGGWLAKGAGESTASGRQLKVFNWSDYIDDRSCRGLSGSTIAPSSDDNYSSDSELETAPGQRRGAYDVVFPFRPGDDGPGRQGAAGRA